MVDSVLNALRQEEINKVAMVVFSNNELGNSFWKNQGFIERTDLKYRNKNVAELIRIDT
ncbi:hypothetical protein [Clostridium sp. Marseille-P299]|uniref:hypothetical protein n=1 Tax=Clostridium sp. Marseille-P299 TaxID=1805477 RepID=UPI000A915434